MKLARRTRPIVLALAALSLGSAVAEAGSLRRSRRGGVPAPVAGASKSDDLVRAAIDATPAGGVAVLPFGRFRTALVVDRPMTIVGDRRGTVLEATGLGRPVIDVAEGVVGVTVEGISIVGSDVEGVLVRATAHGATLRRVAVTNCGGDGVRVLADDARLDLCTVGANRGSGIALAGKRNEALRTSFSAGTGPAARLGGEDTSLSDSTVTGGAEGVVLEGLRDRVFRVTFRGVGVAVRFAPTADTCEVSRCDARGAATFLVADEGSTYGRVAENRVGTTTADAIVLRGSWHTVEGNVVAGSRASAVVGDGQSLRVLENQLGPSAARGVSMSGLGNTVEGNAIRSTGGDAVVVEGDANIVARNECLRAGGAGVVVDGTMNQVVANRVDDAVREGIVVEGDVNRLQDNRLSRAGLEGIVVAGGRGNVLMTNRLTDCGGRGLLDAGAETTLERNQID